jgi:hypothetical protein
VGVVRRKHAACKVTHLLCSPSSTPNLPVAAAVAAQAAIALTCIAGGSAAWGGASLLSSLQKS